MNFYDYSDETSNCKIKNAIYPNQITKLDPYCAVNCKRQPITKRILEYIGNIENGYYIEAGAYDGILQSNTKFLEEEFNWTGILIEPSPKVFIELEKNRPNNININKCLVSTDYPFKTISGSFDNGPMSSVGNMRNIENSTLIDVPCEPLCKILDYLDIHKIDFMTLDTEGYELDVLHGLNLHKYKPTYLLVEIYENNKEATINYLINHNYILLENITNYNKLDNPGWDGTHNDYLFKSM
jgi:FkbM family methyltransferase